MLRLLTYIIVAFALIYILSTMFKFLTSINGTNNQLRQDKGSFIERLQEYELVNWLWKELNVLSLDFQLNHTSRLFNSLYEGVYTSIFGEYLGAVVAKRYGDKHLILLRTSEDLFDLKINNKGPSSLSINEGEEYDLDISDNDINLINGNSRIALTRTDNTAEIKLNGKSIINTNPLESGNKALERLLTISPKSLNEGDEKIVKFLLLFYLIWQELTD